MCGVEETRNKGKRTNDLCGVAPLKTGVLFEIIKGREVWHLVWKGKIDDGVNAQFIKAAIDRIWQNEQVSMYIFPSVYVLIFHLEDLECSKWEGRNCRW
jgi:hypothetical protein